MTVAELASDASAVVGTSFADAAPGLNVPVVNGEPLRFLFWMAWVADAAGTGARFGLTGPSFTRLIARLQYNSSSSGFSTMFPLAAYDSTGPPLGTGSHATDNLCVIEGIVVPSASGTLKPRVQAEVADPGAVTVKAGSSVMYW